MVRLVFRPYTQVWKSICTSEFLRASTRVSPGFALLRHSSPSFGSQHVCSHSDLSSEELWPADSAQRSYHCYFHCAWEFATPILAHMLDSLVRVSRRGKENHFVSILHPRCWLQPGQRTLTGVCHSALSASKQRNMTDWALVSFAYLSAISGTL